MSENQTNDKRRKAKPGILRLDINKPRRSSGSSVEFRNQPELLREQVSEATPSPQLSVRWAYPGISGPGDSSDDQTSQMQNYPKAHHDGTLRKSPYLTKKRIQKRSSREEQLSDRFFESLTIDSSSPFDIPDYLNSEDEDYSLTVSAVMQRRASIRGHRKLGPLSPRRASSQTSHTFGMSTSAGRRRSSAYTTSSDTAISIGDGTNQDSTKEQIFENIKLHKEVLQSVKLQPWSMRRKLRIVRQAKEYIARHEGALQERFAMSRSTRDLWARFKILLAAKWQHYKREMANISTVLIPWELRIKEIESHFGSVVASYFTFLRWLFWVNIIIALTLSIFVVIPEFLASQVPPQKEDHRKQMLPEEKANATRLMSIWDFEGFLKYSPIFYGYYSDFSGAVRFHYQLPLAYFLTGLLVYIYSFWATLRKMAENSRMSKLSSKDDECIFSWKLFTGWDFMIGHAETAHNRIASVVLGFKEALLEEAEKKKDTRNWKVIVLRIIVNFLVLHLLVASAYAVIFVVNRSTEEGANDTYWRRNEITVVITAISFFFPMFFEVLGLLESYHPRKQLRMQLARIMALNLLNLYSLIFALFDKISSMNRTLIGLKGNITSARDSYAMALHSTTMLPSYIYQNLSRNNDFDDIFPTTTTDTVNHVLTTLGRTITEDIATQCHRIAVNCSTIRSNETTLITSLLFMNLTATVLSKVVPKINLTTIKATVPPTTESFFKATFQPINLTNSFFNPTTEYAWDNITATGSSFWFGNITENLNSTEASSFMNGTDSEDELNFYDELATYLKELDESDNSTSNYFSSTFRIPSSTSTEQWSSTDFTTAKWDQTTDSTIPPSSTTEFDEYADEYYFEALTSTDASTEITTQTTKKPLMSITTEGVVVYGDNDDDDDYYFETITSTEMPEVPNYTVETSTKSSTKTDEYSNESDYDYEDDDEFKNENYQNDEYRVTEEYKQCFVTICKSSPSISTSTPPKDETPTPAKTPPIENTNPYCAEVTTQPSFTTDFNPENNTELVTETLTHFIGHMDQAKQLELRKLCWETMFGQELVKLTVMDLVATIVSILCMDFFRALFVRFFNKFWCWDLEKRYPKYGDFKIAENILHLVNNQGQVWMGMFFSPGLAILNLIKLVVIMYMRSWAVLTCNVPHEVVFRASRSNNFYLALLLTMLFLCVLPVGYAIVWLRPSWHCGPFSHYNRIYLIFTDTLRKLLPAEMHRPLDYIASPSTVIPLLLLLILIIYYLISLTGALREANQDLKIQLRRERTEERRKMLKVVNAKEEDASNAGNVIDRWRKVLGSSSPLTPSGASGTPNQVEEEKTAARKELLARIMKKALRKGSNTSDDDSQPAQHGDGDETDTEQNESLPHDDIRTTPKPKKTRKSSGEHSKGLPSRARKHSITRTREAAKKSDTAEVNEHPRGRFKIDQLKPNASSPDQVKGSPSSLDHEDQMKIVSERRKGLLRRQNGLGDQQTVPLSVPKVNNRNDVDYKIVNEKNSATEKKSKTKIRPKGEPEIFTFDEEEVARKRQGEAALSDDDNTSYKEPESDKDKSASLGIPENMSLKSKSSTETLWNKEGEDIHQEIRQKTDGKQYSPPKYATVIKRDRQSKEEKELNNKSDKQLSITSSPTAISTSLPATTPTTASATSISVLSLTDPSQNKSKLKFSIMSLVREVVHIKKQQENPVDGSPNVKAITSSNAPIESKASSSAAPHRGSQRSSKWKLQRNDPPKPPSQDSQASIWSDNIPVITISKTESDECILESHSDHSTPSKRTSD